MGLKTGVFLLGVGFLAACEPMPEGAAGSDGFFATNIGRRVGQAEALAASCPSIRLNNVAVQQYKAAICQRLELEDGCSLPSFESERQRLFAATKASLAALSPEQACVYTRAEAENDGTLTSFLLGAGIPRAAVVQVPVEVEPSEPVGGGWFSL
ncbi:MAG: hypothetical protein COB08_013430 [Rhodobacteraceae bacterium]|nr:hypothetical protein [Paracoccaceae bacterium]